MTSDLTPGSGRLTERCGAGTLEWLPMSSGDTPPATPDAPLIPNAPPSDDERILIRALQALSDMIRALKDTVSYLRSDSTDPTMFVDLLSYPGAGAEATNVIGEMLAEIEALKSRSAVMKPALQMAKEDLKGCREQISEQKAELARRTLIEADLETRLAESLQQQAQKQREAEEAYGQEKKAKAWAQNLQALVDSLQRDLDARRQQDQHMQDLVLEVDAIRDMHEKEMEKMWRETQQLLAQKDKEMARVLQEVADRMEAVRKARMAPWALITDQTLRRADPSYPDLATQKGREQHEDAQLFLLQLLQYTFGTRYGTLCYSQHQSVHYFDETKRLHGEPCCVGTLLLEKVHELIPTTLEDAKQRPSDKFSVLAKNVSLLHEALTASQGPPR
jgi:DNA repair exonuclease SbcCD ATPase subunit